MKVLIVDDEAMIRSVLKEYVQFEGGTAYEAADGMEAVKMCRENDFDIILMDIMMPRLDGFSAVKEIKKIKNIPVIMLSARGEEYDKLFGFEIGADDYVTKPFVIGEVLARVRAVLRRAGATAKRSASDIIEQESIYESDVTFRDLRIDRNDKECYLEGEKLPLTRTEFDILLFFLTHRNRIYSREEIIHNVWGDEVVVTNRTIDTNITRIRKKLGGYDKYIVTRQGFGYGFKEKN